MICTQHGTRFRTRGLQAASQVPGYPPQFLREIMHQFVPHLSHVFKGLEHMGKRWWHQRRNKKIDIYINPCRVEIFFVIEITFHIYFEVPNEPVISMQSVVSWHQPVPWANQPVFTKNFRSSPHGIARVRAMDSVPAPNRATLRSELLVLGHIPELLQAVKLGWLFATTGR